MEMHITRVALLKNGICVWFGKEQRHFEENYYSDGILSLGSSGSHDPRTVRGSIEHLREKAWWNQDLENQMIKECMEIIGRNGELLI